MIQISINAYDALPEIEVALGDMKARAPDVLYEAISETAKFARQGLAKQAGDTYVLKKSRFTKSTKIKKSKASLSAVVSAKGYMLNLFDVGLRQSGMKPGSPVSKRVLRVKVRKDSSMAKLIRPTDQVKSFIVKFKSGHIAVAQRHFRRDNEDEPWDSNLPAHKHGLPIDTLYTLSLPMMLGNEKEVYDKAKVDIERTLQTQIAKHIALVLEEKGAGI